MPDQDLAIALNILRQLQDGQAQIAHELGEVQERLGRIETQIGTLPRSAPSDIAAIGHNPIVIDSATGVMRLGTRQEVLSGAARVATMDDLRTAAHKRMDSES